MSNYLKLATQSDGFGNIIFEKMSYLDVIVQNIFNGRIKLVTLKLQCNLYSPDPL